MSEEQEQLPEEVTPRVVEAVGVSVNQGGEKTDFALGIEEAMAQAVTDAYAAGETDAEKIREKMILARDKFLEDNAKN